MNPTFDNYYFFYIKNSIEQYFFTKSVPVKSLESNSKTKKKKNPITMICARGKCEFKNFEKIVFLLWVHTAV